MSERLDRGAHEEEACTERPSSAHWSWRSFPPPTATFSIAAADPEAGEVGVAVASRFLAVGSVVPWARAGVGAAVATQSNANTTFGPRGLELLERGLRPEKRYPEALRWQRRTAEMAEQRGPGMLPEVLYDLAVILQANGASDEAFQALERALASNPRLREQALRDEDLAGLRARPRQ